jgi:hypothetical protein
MAGALGLGIVTGLPGWLVLVQMVTMAMAATFILTRPDSPRKAG